MDPENNKLTIVPQQNLERGNPLSQIQSALSTSRRIIACQDKDIKEVLRYIMLMLGLKDKDVPNEVEKDLILEFIRDEYPNHTPEEIKLAFKWGITGKTGVDPEIYGKRFAPAFIARFMTAYDTYKQGLNKANLNKPNPNQKQLAEPMERPEDKEKVNLIIQEINNKLHSPTSSEKKAIRVPATTITQQMFHEELASHITEYELETLQSLLRDCVKHSDVKSLRAIQAELTRREDKMKQ